MQYLRHIREFFGLTFKVEIYREEDEDLKVGANKVLLTCVGTGYNKLV